MEHDEITPDTTHGMWEPPGYDEGSSGVGDSDDTGSSGYDGGGPYGGPDDSADGSDPGDASGGGSEGSDDDGSTGTSSSGSGTMTVEVDGQTRELPAEKDYTGDGRPDAAAETSDGKVIIFADTEDNASGEAGPDGKADEAYVVDKQTGQVVGAAHIDPDSGEWVEGVDSDGPGAVPQGGGDTGETGRTGGTGGTGETGETGETGTETTGGTTGSGGGPDVVTVEAGGHTIGVVETVDTDGDGRADSGVVYADGRAIIVTNTDSDPEAEQVAVVDPDTGRVVEVAHVNPETGEWEEGPAPGYGSEDGTGSGDTGSGTGSGSGSGSGSGDTGDTGDTGDGTTGTTAGTTDGGTDGTGTTTGSGSMTVEIDGQTRELPADRDYTGDGRPDAATETSDGKVIIFADTEDNSTGAGAPDGKADEAYVVDKQTGQVVGAAHVDPKTGEWVDGTDTDGTSAVPSPAGQGS
jgi:hypothetical protein